MKFEKGHTKVGGRKAGTPNAVTANVQNGIAEIVNGNIDKLREDLKAMTPKERVDAIAKLLPYVVPRKVETDSRVEVQDAKELRNEILSSIFDE